MAHRDRIIQLRRVKARELVDNSKRWRRHPASQRRALAELLDRVGHAVACIARETPAGLELIDGHLRKDLDPEEILPVLVLDVSQAEADTLLASLDPIASMALADEDALLALLEEAVAPEDVLEELQRQYLGARDALTRPDLDEIPERSTEGRVSPDQVWAMGPHRLVCADAREPSSLARLMEGERAHIAWTDPPYGVEYTGKTADALTIANDGAQGLGDLLAASFAAVGGVLRPGAAIYVCHSAGSLSGRFIEAFEGAGWRLHQTLVWVKDRMVLGHGDYHYRHEPILYGYAPGASRGRGRGGWFGGNDQDSVIEVARPGASPDHPTAKPVELITRCLANSSRRGGIVLDPFAGSGSTLIACEELSRKARLVEIDPVYCDVIIRRWERHTNQEARLLDG